MAMEWGKIGQNNSHALRNLGSFPQTLAAICCGGGVRTALGSEPAETKYLVTSMYYIVGTFALLFFVSVNSDPYT